MLALKLELYADAQGGIEIAKAFNKAISKGTIGPVILGRDHHDVQELIHLTERLAIFMMDLNSQQIWQFKM